MFFAVCWVVTTVCGGKNKFSKWKCAGFMVGHSHKPFYLWRFYSDLQQIPCKLDFHVLLKQNISEAAPSHFSSDNISFLLSAASVACSVPRWIGPVLKPGRKRYFYFYFFTIFIYFFLAMLGNIDSLVTTFLQPSAVGYLKWLQISLSLICILIARVWQGCLGMSEVLNPVIDTKMSCSSRSMTAPKDFLFYRSDMTCKALFRQVCTSVLLNIELPSAEIK